MGIKPREMIKCVEAVTVQNRTARQKGRKTYNPFAVCTANLRKDGKRKARRR
jgi:hypothetical protein